MSPPLWFINLIGKKETLAISHRLVRKHIIQVCICSTLSGVRAAQDFVSPQGLVLAANFGLKSNL